MDERLKTVLADIGQGFIYESEHGFTNGSEEDSRRKLGEFYCKISESENVSCEVVDCLKEAADRLNDTIVPLFQRLFNYNLSAEGYRCVIFLFDENIDLIECEDLIFESIIMLNYFNELSCDVYDEMLKNSPDQKTFENSLTVFVTNLKERAKAMGDENFSDKAAPNNMNNSSMDMGREFIEHLKTQNDKLVAQVNSLEAMISKYMSREQELLQETFSLKTDNLKAETELRSFEKKYSKISYSLQISESKYKKVREMLSQEQNINKKLMEQIEVANDQNAATVGLEEELESLKGTTAQLKQDNESILEKNKDLVSEYETVKKENERLSQEVSSMSNRIYELEAEKKSLDEEIFALRNGMGVMQVPNAPEELPDPPMPDMDMYQNYSYSDFTASMFNDEKDDYTEDDIVVVENKKSSIVKSCNIFSKILSNHFEKKFAKKPQAEQNNLIFVKLMEGNYSKDILTLVKRTIENSNSVSRVDLYKLISNRSSENEVIRFCNNAA